MDWLKEVSEKIKEAMKAKDKVALEALRGLKKELLEASTAKGASDEITNEQGLAIVTKMVKQRNESARIFKEQNRDEMAEAELAEVEVISLFLPEQLSAEEIEAEVKAIIAEVGATSMKEMGKVMGIASKKMAGKADGKEISATVKALLA